MEMSLVFGFFAELVTNLQFSTTSGANWVLRTCEGSDNGLKAPVVMVKIADKAGRGQFCSFK